MTSNIEQIVHIAAEEVRVHRTPEHEVTPLFLNRWSPRAYTNRQVSDQDLSTVLEAAHWAPSSFNDQPWRFFVATTEPELKLFHEFLSSFNQQWAVHAPVLMLLASDRLRPNGDPNSAHAFDAGAAWANLALQATLLEMSAHAMGGFDRDKARSLLNIPEQFDLHVVISLGYRGDKDSLEPGMRESEFPSPRRPMREVIYQGKY
ncbi:MAG: Nitroreductase family protein [Bacilli bacterium]|nr:Nitroreductase family protein [Bacilli bacterium]